HRPALVSGTVGAGLEGRRDSCDNLSPTDLDFSLRNTEPPMQPDRFTIKSQEALQAAQRLADERRNPQTTPEHLLAVLLEQDGGVATRVMHKLAVDPGAVRQALAPGVDALPKLSAGASEPAGGSSELVQVLRD